MSLGALAGFWILTREQHAITETQFLRSMIPHHSGALLMCEKAWVQDPEIKQLCEVIVSSQQAEIDQMKAQLAEFATSPTRTEASRAPWRR